MTWLYCGDIIKGEYYILKAYEVNSNRIVTIGKAHIFNQRNKYNTLREILFCNYQRVEWALSDFKPYKVGV